MESWALFVALLGLLVPIATADHISSNAAIAEAASASGAAFLRQDIVSTEVDQKEGPSSTAEVQSSWLLPHNSEPYSPDESLHAVAVVTISSSVYTQAFVPTTFTTYTSLRSTPSISATYPQQSSAANGSIAAVENRWTPLSFLSALVFPRASPDSFQDPTAAKEERRADRNTKGKQRSTSKDTQTTRSKDTQTQTKRAQSKDTQTQAKTVQSKDTQTNTRAKQTPATSTSTSSSTHLISTSTSTSGALTSSAHSTLSASTSCSHSTTASDCLVVCSASGTKTSSRSCTTTCHSTFAGCSASGKTSTSTISASACPSLTPWTKIVIQDEPPDYITASRKPSGSSALLIPTTTSVSSTKSTTLVRRDDTIDSREIRCTLNCPAVQKRSEGLISRADDLWKKYAQKGVQYYKEWQTKTGDDRECPFDFEANFVSEGRNTESRPRRSLVPFIETELDGTKVTRSYFSTYWADKRTADQEGSKKTQFINSVSASQGIFLATDNNIALGQDIGYYFSDVAWWLWKKSLLQDANGGQQKPVDSIQSFWRVSVVNEDSVKLLQEALGASTDIQSWTPNDTDQERNAFWALLGCPNGTAMIKLLTDHKIALKGKAIRKISAVFEPDVKEYYMWATYSD